jgi:biotin-(acetyl-CoA carboxylase) ligase
VLEDKKVGGVLIRSNIYGNEVHLEVNVGINVTTAPLETSTCLQNHSKATISPSKAH